MISVRAFTRLHAGLIDMGGATPRRHGGAGFMLKEPYVEISACRGTHRVENLSILDAGAQLDVLQLLERIKTAKHFPGTTITIQKFPKQHSGLGTKTALLLAILKACELFGDKVIPQNDLQRLSHRGGVSGIGTHGFFQGGFLIDGGQPTKESVTYAPSSYYSNLIVPNLHIRLNIPETWRFVLCLPSGRHYSGNIEREFFERVCPIPQNEIYQTMAAIYHGILPAIIESDLRALKTALQSMHSYGFKQRELSNQSECVQSLFKALCTITNCAVGMSSMGPLLYAIVDINDSETLFNVRSFIERAGVSILCITQGQNGAFEIA